MTNPNFYLVGHEIETPLVNAAGSISGIGRDLILREVETLASTAIGAITVGSFTVPSQVGNIVKYGSPTYYHDEKTGATYNSMGLPNIGWAAAKELMPKITARAHEKGKPVIASVSPTQATPEVGSPFHQVTRLVSELQFTDVDLIEINTSCPNVVSESGGRKPILGYDLEAMLQLVAELGSCGDLSGSRLGVKLPPYLSEEERGIVPELAKLFNESRVFSFIVTANTIPNQIARHEGGSPVLSVPGGAGGMSGPATKEVGREQLQIWKDLIDDEIDIISTLGMDSGKELAMRRKLGATAAGGVTFLWERDNWGAAVTDVITEWATEVQM